MKYYDQRINNLVIPAIRKPALQFLRRAYKRIWDKNTGSPMVNLTDGGRKLILNGGGAEVFELSHRHLQDECGRVIEAYLVGMALDVSELPPSHRRRLMRRAVFNPPYKFRDRLGPASYLVFCRQEEFRALWPMIEKPHRAFVERTAADHSSWPQHNDFALVQYLQLPSPRYRQRLPTLTRQSPANTTPLEKTVREAARRVGLSDAQIDQFVAEEVHAARAAAARRGGKAAWSKIKRAKERSATMRERRAKGWRHLTAEQRRLLALRGWETRRALAIGRTGRDLVRQEQPRPKSGAERNAAPRAKRKTVPQEPMFKVGDRVTFADWPEEGVGVIMRIGEHQGTVGYFLEFDHPNLVREAHVDYVDRARLHLAQPASKH